MSFSEISIYQLKPDKTNEFEAIILPEGILCGKHKLHNWETSSD